MEKKIESDNWCGKTFFKYYILFGSALYENMLVLGRYIGHEAVIEHEYEKKVAV